PYAAWMPRKSLHGRIHGVSREGGRARALQPDGRSHASTLLLKLCLCLIQIARPRTRTTARLRSDPRPGSASPAPGRPR
ncbi:hypothetical protein XaplCFBP3122_15385, partial [Xanthomonas arboricola pv. populi]